MSSSFSELSAAATSAAKEIAGRGDAADEGAPAPAHPALVTRTSAEAMNTGLGIPSSGGSGQVLLSGALKKRDGLVVKKWIDVYVELRENSLTCFGSADKSSILDTLVIDAGIEFVFTEKDKLPALIVKKASARGPLAKELILGAETEALRDQWAETLDACCLKARSHVEAKKMVQEEAAARARKEAELQRKALEDAARSRQQAAQTQGTAESATFALDELDSPGPPPRTPSRDGEAPSAAAATPAFAAGPMTPSAADQHAATSSLQPSTPAQPPDGRKGGRMSLMGSRMRSAFANVPSVSLRGKEGGEGAGEAAHPAAEQLEETMKDMMLAEANHQLRQLQHDLQKEREQNCQLRDQVRQLMSEDGGLLENRERMEAAEAVAEEAERKAQGMVDAARRREQEVLGELEALRQAAAAAAGKKASEAAARDLKQSQDEEEQEASRRQIDSLKHEVLRLQEELAQVGAAAEQRAAAAEEALMAAVRLNAAAQAPAEAGSAAQQHLACPPDAAAMLAPASIGEFCSANGLERYAELMVDNEIDLDVLPDLAEEDWEELGVDAADLPRLLAAVERLCRAQEAAGGAAGGVGGVLAAGDAETAGDASENAGVEGVERRERAVREREEQAGGREREGAKEPQARQSPLRAHEIELQDAEAQHVAHIQALMMQEGWTS